MTVSVDVAVYSDGDGKLARYRERVTGNARGSCSFVAVVGRPFSVTRDLNPVNVAVPGSGTVSGFLLCYIRWALFSVTSKR